MSTQPSTHNPRIAPLDGDGAGDHDEPFRFGRRPNVRWPYPFTERQYARLLILRGRVRDSLACPECDGDQAA
jgi:hypothetical protein